MSRCFPFPPPGYEKKIKADEANLILKEKHREKKHKKDKEKKDKSKSEKPKDDDKDRKEKKHRDKKHKKRDKHKSPDEKKLVLDGKQFSETRDSKILAELGKRLGNDDATTADNCLLRKIIPVDIQGKPKLLEKECHSDSKVAHSHEHIREKRELHKIASTQHLKANARDFENGFASSGRVRGEIQNKGGDFSSQVEKVFSKRNEESEKISQRNNELHRHEQREDKKSNEAKKVDIVKDSIKNSGKSSDFREAMETHEHWGNLLKRKVPESNGFLHDNGIRANKGTTQNGSNSHPRQNNHKVNNADLVMTAANNNHMASNGFASSPVLGTGKKTAPCQAAPKLEPRLVGSHSVEPRKENERIGQKDLRKNGTKEGTMQQKTSPSSTKPKEKPEKLKKKKKKKDKSHKSTKKSPHPDLKYLDRILTVPLQPDWPVLGDEEWLSVASDSPAKKPKLAEAPRHQPEPAREVWAEAMRLGSTTNAIALPYVIPF